MPVAPEEDRILRAAFGRYGGRPAARDAAATVVRRYQQLKSGMWFLCDCRPSAERRPALVPVSQTHVRRHQDARWPMHCEFCDFHREPAEQQAITLSHSRGAAARPLRLARSFETAGSAALEQRLVAFSHDIRRPGLARLLMRLLTDAGLQRIGAGWRPPSLPDQAKAIWTAARSVEIDPGVNLPEFLCTSPAKLPGLIERIAAVKPGRFTRTRPHGILIARLAGVADGRIIPVSGEPISVRGRLAVFGERVGDGRETHAERAARAPYLAACVLGRAAPADPVEVLSAYAHPCAADNHLLLVDSEMERRTLAQIRRVQSWLGHHRSLTVAIEKPLFDIGPEAEDEATPRPPCIPDFIVRAERGGDVAQAAAVVETMGFADPEYRARKHRMHAVMSALAGNAPAVVHDFHEPPNQSQSWRDTRFWRDLRWTITGAEDGKARSPAPAGTATGSTHRSVFDAKL